MDNPYDLKSGQAPGLPPIMPGKLILNGENPFIRLSEKLGAEFSSDASLWSINYSPYGDGHVLFIKSELFSDEWRIFSDNAPLVEYLQKTVQGMLNPETVDPGIEIFEASFVKTRPSSNQWRQEVLGEEDHVVLEWSKPLEPMLMAHEHAAGPPERLYSASVLMLPVVAASLRINGQTPKGRVWPCRYDGREFSTACLAYSESWREQG